jgi:hypothetical protein
LGRFRWRPQRQERKPISTAAISCLGTKSRSACFAFAAGPTAGTKVETSSQMIARLVWTNPFPRPFERHGGKRHWQAAMAATWSLRSNNQMENGNAPMSSTHPDTDYRGHILECPWHGKDIPRADESSTHVDLFCDCHKFKEPKILANGTDIAWPAGWTPEQALVWRDKNGLAAPAPI